MYGGSMDHQEVMVEEERGRALDTPMQQMGAHPHEEMEKRLSTTQYVKQEINKQKRAQKARQR